MTSSEGFDADRFQALVGPLRTDLHRYCARLTGSVIDGEDVVQDALTRAFVALRDGEPPEHLRGWLFRVAHNRALDLLRRREIRKSEGLDEIMGLADPEAVDPVEAMMREEAVRTAISRFVELPTTQRSVVILKDVLDQSLQEIADLLGLTLNAVKAHLARGRAGLARLNAEARGAPTPYTASEAVARYIHLFHRHDWDGLRDLLAADVRLKQSSLPLRSGAADVGVFFTIYARTPDIRLVPARLEGREVIAVFEGGRTGRPNYAMWLEWRDDRISFIHDYRYVRDIFDEAEFVLATANDGV